jgi:hypothetical protein
MVDSWKQTMATLPQPSCSPNLALSDFFLFPRLISSLKGRHFGAVKYVQVAVTNALKEIPVQGFQVSCAACQNRWQPCIDPQGCYFEEY